MVTLMQPLDGPLGPPQNVPECPSSHGYNRSVALFDAVPLHLRSLRRIGAPRHWSHNRRGEPCAKFLILL